MVEVPARWSLTIGVVLAAGMAGLILLPAVVPIARQVDVDPGLVEYTALPLVWNALVLA
jgi:TRAP-type C4-dicarboxylate transport system permease large subunit